MMLVERKIDNYLIEGSGKRVLNFDGIDEVGTFYVVTKPTEHSELIDIIFEADIFDMYLQFRGGLKGSDIVGIYKKKGTARKKAKELMKQKNEI